MSRKLLILIHPTLTVYSVMSAERGSRFCSGNLAVVGRGWVKGLASVVRYRAIYQSRGCQMLIQLLPALAASR